MTPLFKFTKHERHIQVAIDGKHAGQIKRRSGGWVFRPAPKVALTAAELSCIGAYIRLECA